MGVADSARNMAGKAKAKMDPDKTKERVDKVGDKLDQATKGRYSDRVDRGQEAAKSGIDRVMEKDEEQSR